LLLFFRKEELSCFFHRPIHQVRRIGILAAAIIGLSHPADANDDRARLKDEAAGVSIVRDDWGIAHVHGHTDAQAVFGMIYAQAEDDFDRIEMNYLTALGRVSEAEGERAVMQDLRARLYIDPADLRARYAASPPWLKALMDAWANGLNYYLATHPGVTPKVLRRFEPWMALSFTEGSIGGDIESISLPDMAAFYGWPKFAMLDGRPGQDKGEPSGSNGIAIAPSNTKAHHALLLINPHTSFYFRAELQMSSDAGLDAYGAATWGQFFLYQGFNQRLGWMHTSTQSNAVDRFLETVVPKGGKLFYRYGSELRPLATSTVTISYRKNGTTLAKSFTIYKTHHGPIVGKAADGRWVSEAMMFAPVPALEQSYGLTKAQDYTAYMKVMALQANTSNNTVYADADGNIAYLHPQFIPRRDPRFDYTKPVDGADPHTDWHGLHALDEAPHLLNPATGWIQNTNNWPYSAAGAASPRREDFPAYMDVGGENMRGLHAAALLKGRHDFTLASLVGAAFDPGQPGFDILIPRLIAAYDGAATGSPVRAELADQIGVLRTWDRRWSADSVATTLAVYWGEALWRQAGVAPHRSSQAAYDQVLAHTSQAQWLASLASAASRLNADFGTWRTPWGQANRFQRLSDDIEPHFADSAPSLPVARLDQRAGDGRAETPLRQRRQQLRRRGRVRPQNTRAGGHRRRRERRYAVQAFR
jgi:acyl-homoserine-lactone acylase